MEHLLAGYLSLKTDAHEQADPGNTNNDQRSQHDDQGVDQGSFDLGLAADLQYSIIESLSQHAGHGLHSADLNLAADHQVMLVNIDANIPLNWHCFGG